MRFLLLAILLLCGCSKNQDIADKKIYNDLKPPTKHNVKTNLFRVGDCIIHHLDLENLQKDMNEWEREPVLYYKITKVGKVKYGVLAFVTDMKKPTQGLQRITWLTKKDYLLTKCPEELQ